jgi:putative DNA primase/helicase
MENYQDVVHQMMQAGCEFKPKDLPLHIPTPKRRTCGVKGKWWYLLQIFRRRDGKEYVVGKFGCYSTKAGVPEQKIEIDWKPLSDEERERFAAERRAAEERARQAKERAAEQAAGSAAEILALAEREGASPYLQRKGVEPESCRFLTRAVRMRRQDPAEPPILLPPGTLVLPLIRYDKPRDQALRGLQLLKPDGFKLYTEGFSKNGCAVRLGTVDASTRVAMICEGYATGLTIRMATGRRWPVFVGLDAYNLLWVVEILRAVYPHVHLLVCADDDWKTKDHDGANPGRRKAMLAARTTTRCEIVWPVFDPALRQEKDTDFNDLHAREGLDAVARQLLRVLAMIEKG